MISYGLGLFQCSGNAEIEDYRREYINLMVTAGSCSTSWSHIHKTGECRFPRGDTSMRTSKTTTEFFCDRALFLLKWDTCILDLNPGENMWAIFVLKV